MKQKIIDVNRYQWKFTIKNFFLFTLLKMRIKKYLKYINFLIKTTTNKLKLFVVIVLLIYNYITKIKPLLTLNMQEQHSRHPQQSFSKQQLQQSEILDKKFIELLISRKEVMDEDEQYQFQIDEDEEQKIKAQFRNICQGKEEMDYSHFRDSLGLLGREDSFISRIFHIIDLDKIGYITQEDYLKYIRTILHGSLFQQQLLAWKIVSGGKNELDLKDLVILFEQISIVWNALTGQIVQPKKKYIEELFSILDVDQDEVITFQDYRVFYKEQPLIFGWFQYLNNIDINDNITKLEMQKMRNLLQVQNFSNKKSFKNAEQLKQLMDAQQTIIDTKMSQVIKQIESAATLGNELLTNISSSQLQLKTSETRADSSLTSSSLSSLSHLGKYFTNKTNNSLSSSLKNSEQMSRLKRRKQKQEIQQNKQANQEMIKQLEKIMQRCYKAMNACSQYRQMKQLSHKYSPTKLKLKQAKIQAVTQKQSQKQQEEKVQKKKKKNILVYFGHQNWNLVLNIMVGLRKSIRSLYELNSFLELKSAHFKDQHEFLLGNKTLSGKSKEVYKFIQIAPVVFQKLRTNYGITNLQYQRSVGPESLLNSLLMGNLTGLNQKCSTGKSGSFFYLTLDSKIFLKTIPKHQFLFFIQILQNYYRHMKQFHNTLIVRIYGLYKLKIYEKKQKVNTIYFISMENIFKDIAGDTSIKIKQVYDLKGSLYGRSGIQGKQLKDNDWVERKKKINLKEDVKKIFKNQIKIDSRFFKHNNINDYSLMVTIAEIDKQIWEREKSQDQSSEKSNNTFKPYKGGIMGTNEGQFYILSIIDILTVFEMRKKIEYAFKSTFLSKDVSCIPPTQYCKRFRNFMYQTVEEDLDDNATVYSQ